MYGAKLIVYWNIYGCFTGVSQVFMVRLAHAHAVDTRPSLPHSKANTNSSGGTDYGYSLDVTFEHKNDLV